MKHTRFGWPDQLPIAELQPYHARKDDIGMERGFVMMGLRFVIPPSSRKQLLEEVHTGHPGKVKSKAVAGSCMWWPGLDKDLEETCRTCEACQTIRPNPPAVTTPMDSSEKAMGKDSC